MLFPVYESFAVISVVYPRLKEFHFGNMIARFIPLICCLMSLLVFVVVVQNSKVDCFVERGQGCFEWFAICYGRIILGYINNSSAVCFRQIR